VIYFYIIGGAAIGAPLRYFIGSHVQRWSGGSNAFPLGTMAVNITGCLLIGLIATLALEKSWLNKETRALLVTGFLGSYTTFSAFGLETYSLGRDGDLLKAIANVTLSVVLGILAVWAGVRIAESM
jgi:CrcB protein